jgi:hypothetical protein
MGIVLVIKLALIFFLAILPLLIYLAIFHKVKQRWQTRLRRVQRMTYYPPSDENSSSYSHENYQRELEPYFIGDLSCQYNAHSPYIRCAVNPEGPCEQCNSYTKK